MNEGRIPYGTRVSLGIEPPDTTPVELIFEGFVPGSSDSSHFFCRVGTERLQVRVTKTSQGFRPEIWTENGWQSLGFFYSDPASCNLPDQEPVETVVQAARLAYRIIA